MIAIRGLAVAAVLGVAAIAMAPRVGAEPGREKFALEFRYDSTRKPVDNYVAFARQIERACENPGRLGLAMRHHDVACVEDMLDHLIARMARAELADIHATRTGRRDDSSRTLAAR